MKICFLLYLLIQAIAVPAQVKFDFPADEHDFGTLEEGEIYYYSFEFINAGKDTIRLTEENRDVRPSCGCTSSEFSKEPVAPGEKGYIKAGYNTLGRTGAFIKTITVAQKGNPYKILTLKGFVIKKTEKKPLTAHQLKKAASVVLETHARHFGKTAKGKFLSHRFPVKNAGKDTLKMLAFYSGCNCINFKLINAKDFSNIPYILPGKSALLEVNYTPMVTSHLSDLKTKDILTIFTNDPQNPKVELTLSAELAESTGAKNPGK